MALADRPLVQRVLSEAQERLGITVQPTREVNRLRTVEAEYGEMKQDAEELALHSLDYFGNRPQEMRPERRRRLAQRSRIALMQDPLAGAEAELLSNFAFGKGVSKPTARDPKVQEVIDSAWTDPVNEQLLCGYMAQRRLSNELLTSGEIFITLYENGQFIRVGKLDPDTVVNVVPDPENRNIPLYYVARQRNYGWDYDLDTPDFKDEVVGKGGRAVVKYWPHWRNVEDAVKDRARWGTEDDEQPLEQPPPEKLAKGRVYHVAINQTGEQLRGNPPWARSLRFMTAMNVLTEAHVTMAQAASTFVARRAMKGSPRQITKAASNILASAGELGASAFRSAAGYGAGGNAEPTTQPFTGPGIPGPYPPGSWWSENMDTSRLEALNLKSNAGEMAQSAQIVRAPVAASSGFGQHYLGDATSANLATASCYDAATETLTEDGWLTLEQLKLRQAAGTLPRIAAFDTGRATIVYQEADEAGLRVYPYRGKMAHFRAARGFDICVTPNHRMLVRRGDTLDAANAFEFIEAQHLPLSRHFSRTAAVFEDGIRVEEFVLPGCRRKLMPGRRALNDGQRERDARIRALAAESRMLAPGLCACGCGQATAIATRNRSELGHVKGEPVRFVPGHNSSWRGLARIAAVTGCTRETVRVALGEHERPRRENPDASYGDASIPMDAWLSWLGWYIAEGSGAGELTQSVNSRHLPDVQAACRSLGVAASERVKTIGGSDHWVWRPRAGRQFRVWLEENVGAGASNKRVPPFVFSLAREQQLLLLRGLMGGDGSFRGEWEVQGGSYYATTSRQLASDVQRLATHCGLRARMRSLGRYMTKRGERESWTVNLYAGRGPRKSATHAILPAPEWRDYDGEVYCFTLPASTIVTRRGGFVAIQGQTLELPATMRVGAWQEFFEQMYRWFTDRAIEAAVKTGKLGGGEGYPDEKPLAEMHLQEAEHRQAMERRTGKDLSYEFSMPFPGRRQLADVTALVQETSLSQDPNGVNIPLRRILLRFLFEQIGIDDISRAVEECIPEKGMPGGIGPQNPPTGAFAGSPAAGGALGAGGGTGAGQGAGANDPGEGQQPYGAKSGTAAGGGSAGADGALEGEWLPEDKRESVERMTGQAATLFKQLVADPATAAALEVNGNK